MAILATACGGLDEDDFIDGWLNEACRLAVDCADEDDFMLFESQSDCVTFMKIFGGSSIGSGCEYDAKIAKTCLSYLESQTCSDIESAGDDGVPSACEGVYVGECDFTGSGGDDTGGEDTDDP
jgi:hypothetical protein